LAGAADGTFYYFENVGGTFTAQVGTNNPFDGFNIRVLKRRFICYTIFACTRIAYLLLCL